MDRIEFAAEKGQTMAEYAVILAVITIAIVSSFSLLAGAIEVAFNRTLEIVGGIV
jgi:Flp pilus assembly pilin Flp